MEFEGSFWEYTLKRMDEVYGQAAQEMEEKFRAYTERFLKEDEQKKQDVANGKITEQQYKDWRVGKVMTGKNWKNMRDTLANDLSKTNRKALAFVNNILPKAYTAGYNEVSKEELRGFSFALVDESTIKAIITSNKTLLPYIEINGKKDVRWNTKQINSAVLQGILQGESLDKIAKRMQQAVGGVEGRWLNNARTAVNSAENRGRQQSYERMDEDGIDVFKEWIYTTDGRTRKSHEGPPFGVGGEIVKFDEDFSNGLEYPCDPDGDPEEVYGCRCTMGSDIRGFRHKNYSKARAKREEKVAVGERIYDTRDALDKFKEDNEDVWELEDVWKDKVTLDDYMSKKDSIDAKHEYFQKMMDKYDGVDIDKFLKFRELDAMLDQYAYLGEQYAKMQQELQDLMGRMATLDGVGGAPVGSPFGQDAYTQARKDAALWFTNKNGGKPAADKVFRDQCGEIWRNATKEEKEAIYEYTASYHKYNEPLRGIIYGQSTYVGVGKVDLDMIGVGGYGGFQKGRIRKEINAITDIIDKSPLQHDTWFNRGCEFSGMDKFFQCSSSLLEYGSQAELEKNLLGKTVTEYAFMSTSSKKGDGFGGNIMLNIYAPKGTKAMYVEPFSHYGVGVNGKYGLNRSDGLKWDGKHGQNDFSSEFETLFQQGTEMRVTKINREGDTIWFDLEVIGQGKVQR